MAEIELVRFDIGDGEKTIKQLKEEISQLKKQLDECAIGSEDAARASQELERAQAELTGATKGAIDATGKLDSSYNGLVAQMKTLKAEWRATNDEAKRKELGGQINDINGKLKDMDASVGVFSRNVGNYQSAFEALGNKGAGAVMNGIKGIKTGFDGLKAHPFITIVSVAVTVLMSIVAAVKKNEVAMNNLKKAFAPIQGIINGITKAFDWLVEKFTVGLAVIGNLTNKVLDFLHIGNEARKLTNDIANQEIANQENHRKNLERNAQLELEIAELRAKASDKENESAKDRLKYIQEAADKQRELAQNRLQEAQDELKLLELQGNTGVNDTEMNNKLAEARAKVLNVQRDYNNTLRETNTQISEVSNKIKAENKAAIDAVKKHQEEVKKLRNEYKGITDSLDDELTLDEFIKEARAIDREYEETVKKLDEEKKKKAISDKEYDAAVYKAQEVQFVKTLKLYENQAQAEQAYYDEMRKVYATDAELKVLAEQDKWNKVSKTIEEAHKAGLISEEVYSDALVKIAEESEKAIKKVETESARDALINSVTSNIDKAVAEQASGNLFKGFDLAIQTVAQEIVDRYGNNEIDEEITIALLRQLGIDDATLENVFRNKLSEKLVSALSESVEIVKEIASTTEIAQPFMQVFDQFQLALESVHEALEDGGSDWTKWGRVAATSIATVGSLFSAMAEQQDNNTKEGFEQQKKYQIAAASMNMLAGVVSAVTSAFNPSNSWMTIWGQLAMAISTSAMVIGMGAKQIADIKKQQFGGGATASVPSSSGISNTVVPPVQYTQDVNGSNIEESIKDSKVYVVESDITDTQKRVRTSQTENRY